MLINYVANVLSHVGIIARTTINIIITTKILVISIAIFLPVQDINNPLVLIVIFIEKTIFFIECNDRGYV